MKKLLLLFLTTVVTYGYAYSQNITKLEYFLDTDPGYGNATSVSITPSPALSEFTFNIPLSLISDGLHTLYVRVQNANNKWSPLQNRPFVKLALPANISRVEYFIDTDPGPGNGTAVDFTAGVSIADLTFDVPAGSLTDGYHTLYVRLKDSNNRWSTIQNRPFVKIPAKPNITYIEYYIDSDPGQGQGTSVAFTPAPIITDLNFSVDVASLSQGNHNLYVRGKNANNKWSETLNQIFSVCDLPAPVATGATLVTNTTFIANWNAVPGATGYEADLSLNDFTTFDKAAFSTTSAEASGLFANTVYKYRIRAINSQCASLNSNIISVTTRNCSQPPKPVVTLINDNTETPTLTSSSATGNQWYRNGEIITGATNKTLTVTTPGLYKVQVTLEDCVSEFSNEFVIVITGLENPANGIVLYPNPATDKLYITRAKETAELIVTDALGRKIPIAFHWHEKTYSADIKDLSMGIYFVTMCVDNSVHQIKFVKN